MQGSLEGRGTRIQQPWTWLLDENVQRSIYCSRHVSLCVRVPEVEEIDSLHMYMSTIPLIQS